MASATLPTLIIIDMQKGMASPAAGSRNNPDAESNIATLLDAWRKAGATVVHVRHMSRTVGSPFRPGQPGVEFQEALAPLPSEHVVEKNVPDALANLDGEYAAITTTQQLLETIQRNASL